AGSILTITFTEKAAAELRQRIRRRLREAGAQEAARATEGAFISTIHGFCARVLRTHALAAGIDPGFSVLDQAQARRLASLAFDHALEELAGAAGGGELVAAYGPLGLREATLDIHAELRARGQLHPRLPEPEPVPALEPLRAALSDAAREAARELGSDESPAARVRTALKRLEQCDRILSAADPWPGELERAALPNGGGAALESQACARYADALRRLRAACSHRRAHHAHALLDSLLGSFGAEYERLKRAASGLDFEDLELLCRALLVADSELRDRLRTRFVHVMVDELQDTNLVQLELIESICAENLFTVGDAQQAIYGFRHADVELFERLGQRRAAAGERATLTVNFRSRPEIIAALNDAFSQALEERFRPLRAGRTDLPASEPVVELLVADKEGDGDRDGLAAPWRLAEARALARRVRELLDDGATAREIVVLTRATTDLRAYERALEESAVPTYLIGGRGYWSHPQVVDMVCYLRALANPLDEEALYTVLASPVVGLSLDGLVALAAGAAEAKRDPWSLLRDGDPVQMSAIDHERVERFRGWFLSERAASARAGADELIDRVLSRSGYDLAILALPGGQRRLANVRKLMRLGREHWAAAGLDLRGFLEDVCTRGADPDGTGGGGDPRESEAPVEGEALDAVRLMTIHRAKGLEFQTVCVADLGRGAVNRAELLRVGRDGRLGLRLARPGGGQREPALHYAELGAERQRLEAEEERRLFYVAMTRAQERLICSGAAKLSCWPSRGGGPIAWIGPAFIPDIAARVGEGSRLTEAGIRLTVVSGQADAGAEVQEVPEGAGGGAAHAPVSFVPEPGPSSDDARSVAPLRLSYSALAAFDRCGYRFYAERVLGLPAVSAQSGGGATGRLGGGERGTLIHAALERLDFRRPVPVPVASRVAPGGPRPSPAEADELDAMVDRFAASELCVRLGRARGVRREERFAFLLASGALMSGAFDVLAQEGRGRSLVLDYKSDDLEGAEPESVVQRAYLSQRLIYALAALRAGAREVEVVHLFLQAPDRPAGARYLAGEADRLAAELEERTRGIRERRFSVTEVPQRSVCSGCPAEGGLCSWPLELTRRESPQRLF
ncbi:MAG: UvrD-helicase domain-containing protein, partial [Actinomycetota bacterium]|nr:UvrD-helicase domain-containing protein [Actinomycetota bacterium]